jgi:hypothetical protein
MSGIQQETAFWPRGRLLYLETRKPVKPATNIGTSEQPIERSRTRLAKLVFDQTWARATFAQGSSPTRYSSGSHSWYYHSASRHLLAIGITEEEDSIKGALKFFRALFSTSTDLIIFGSSIRLPDNSSRSPYVSDSGPLSTLASVPWFVLGLVGASWAYVSSWRVWDSVRPRTGYRNVPVDEDAQVLRFEDEE